MSAIKQIGNIGGSSASLPVSAVVYVGSGSSSIAAKTMLRATSWIAILDSGNEILYTSQDGTTWNERTPGRSSPSGAACKADFGAIVVCGGSAGNPMRRSTDNGATWANVTNPTSTTALTAIRCAGSTFIAVRSGAATEIARSTDSGATFSSVTVTSGTYTNIAGNGSGTWLLAGSTTSAQRSTDDGATWSSATLGLASEGGIGLAFNNGKFWISDGNGFYAYSTTGATGSWTIVPVGYDPNYNSNMTSEFTLASNNDIFYNSGNLGLEKIDLTSSLATTSTVITGAPFATNGGFVYFGGYLYTAGQVGNGASQIFRISNLP